MSPDAAGSGLFRGCCSSVPTSAQLIIDDDALTAPSTPKHNNKAPPPLNTTSLLRLLNDAEARSQALINGARRRRAALLQQAAEEAEEEASVYRQLFEFEFSRLENRHRLEGERLMTVSEENQVAIFEDTNRKAARNSAATIQFLIERCCDVELEIPPSIVAALRRRHYK